MWWEAEGSVQGCGYVSAVSAQSSRPIILPIIVRDIRL